MAVNLGREGFASCASDGLVVLWKVSRFLHRAFLLFLNAKETNFAEIGSKARFFFLTNTATFKSLKSDLTFLFTETREYFLNPRSLN